MPIRGHIWAAVLVAGASCVFAQTSGQAEIATQGFYMRTGTSPATATTGVAVKLDEFIPKFGLVRANVSAYRSQGNIRPADNFLQLRGLVWKGLRWNLNGGDFRSSGTLLPIPFTNIFFPELQARGAQVEAGDEHQSYTAFYGQETVLAGPRIPFRVSVPQRVMGASARRTIGSLETGVRLLHLFNTVRAQDQDYFFPAGRDYKTADNLTAYASYEVGEHFRWYSELTEGWAQSAKGGAASGALSYLVGPSWDSAKLTVRANYANLSRTYLPIAGYYIGDRKGPFGEVRVRPWQRLEMFASGSRYQSASRPIHSLPYLASRGTSAGVSLELPRRMNATVQMSTTALDSTDLTKGVTQSSFNRQWVGTMSVRLPHQTVRFTARDMQLRLTGQSSRQRSGEVEDILQYGHFTFGGAVRGQQSLGSDRRNAIYVRGTAQWSLGRVSAFGFFESGKDLANQTVFATSATNSTVFNASVRLTKDWNIQGEAFRSRLVSQLNAGSLFLQGSQEPLFNPVLNQFQQWSFLFRVNREMHWGKAMAGLGTDQFTARQVPITGTVEGLVYVHSAAGREPARGIAIQLENGQRAFTGADGKFSLFEVPQGQHTVGLDMEQLPADLNPGSETSGTVTVVPRKAARMDFELYALGGFGGRVRTRTESELETLSGMLVHLLPGKQYTITAADGSFAFYNVPDGEYEVRVAENTLPEEARAVGLLSTAVSVRSGSAGVTEFLIERKPVQAKPVRKVVETMIPAPTVR